MPTPHPPNPPGSIPAKSLDPPPTHPALESFWLPELHPFWILKQWRPLGSQAGSAPWDLSGLGVQN